MFDERKLSDELAGVRADHAPDTLVFDCERDFETLPPPVAEELAVRVTAFDPVSYPREWIPEDAPEQLHRLASDEFTVGTPGDGGVAWTRQTAPPSVFVKPRLEGSPEAFVDFLLAEALARAGTDLPEQFLGFFEERYRDLDSTVPLDPAATYQLANALYDAYAGLHTRPTFSDWADPFPDLHAQWVDAGQRLGPRIDGLPREIVTGETGFAAAAELACAGVKHGLDLPAPFAALDTKAYREHGAAFAVRWATKTFEALD